LPPSAPVPPLPGQQTTAPTLGERASATASACSRPPEPTTITVAGLADGSLEAAMSSVGSTASAAAAREAGDGGAAR
jgi:hypothetical protein